MSKLSKETIRLIEKANDLIPAPENEEDNYPLEVLIESAENGLSSDHADGWDSEEDLQEYIIEFTAQFENESD